MFFLLIEVIWAKEYFVVILHIFIERKNSYFSLIKSRYRDKRFFKIMFIIIYFLEVWKYFVIYKYSRFRHSFV